MARSASERIELRLRPEQRREVEQASSSLDSWLAQHARGAEARRSARTFVWHQGDHVVVAYYTLAARFVVVDAIDDTAASFYEHHGFRAIPGTTRLI